MLIAIPTVDNNKITDRFGRMTEITFLEFKDKEVINQYTSLITKHASHGDKNKHKHNKRHDEILEKLTNVDMLVYKSLCKNWRTRLAEHPIILKRVNNDLLKDITVEVKETLL